VEEKETRLKAQKDWRQALVTKYLELVSAPQNLVPALKYLRFA
jgi:hypothetical protein